MAKSRLDWFKLDCQCDDKIELIEAEFGLKGFALVIKLFQKIYGGEGYYCKWDSDVALLFARKNGVSGGFVSEVIKKCIKRGIFDARMFSEHGILTSHGIQKRYYECTERRKFSRIRNEYLLLSCALPTGNCGISSKNDDISAEKYIISDTEKRKENENIKDDRKEDEYAAVRLGKFGTVSMPLLEYRRLTDEYGEEPVKRYIEKMDSWQHKTGNRISGCAGRIREWAEKDGVQKLDFDSSKYDFVINKF